MIKKAAKIKLIVLDVDGTLTEGGIQIDSNGNESKVFHVRDGFSIVQAEELGLKFAIITGKESEIVKFRAKELRISEVHQGVKNKALVLNSILEKHNILPEETAYMGDDLNDVPAMKIAGFVGSPEDGIIEVKELADFISDKRGGKGAVRDFVDYILKAKGLYCKLLEKYS